MITIREIDHVVLRVIDLDAMLRFYTQALGCTIERRQDEIGLAQLRAGRSLVDLVSIDGKLGRIGGAAPGAEGRNVDHFCFRVEPFDEGGIRAHLAEYGVDAGKVESRTTNLFESHSQKTMPAFAGIDHILAERHPSYCGLKATPYIDSCQIYFALTTIVTTVSILIPEGGNLISLEKAITLLDHRRRKFPLEKHSSFSAFPIGLIAGYGLAVNLALRVIIEWDQNETNSSGAAFPRSTRSIGRCPKNFSILRKTTNLLQWW